MGLGSNSGQVGGKSRGALVKRAKERTDAKNYTLILSTAGQGSSACGVSVGANQFYHDGSSAFPAVDDKVYSIKRVNATYYLANGHYRMHVTGDERTTKNIEISSGVVTRVTACP